MARESWLAKMAAKLLANLKRKNEGGAQPRNVRYMVVNLIEPYAEWIHTAVVTRLMFMRNPGLTEGVRVIVRRVNIMFGHWKIDFSRYKGAAVRALAGFKPGMARPKFA
jgi:hypothetical protein